MLDFISYNRLNTFLDRLLVVRNTITSTTYVDNSPNGLFTSPAGTILQKRGNLFSYKYPTDSDFTIINYANNSIQKLCDKYSVALSTGVNKNVTWVKLDDSPGTKWQNRGLSSDVCIICEIAPAPPCSTPIVTYIVPTLTPTPTGTPVVYCCPVDGSDIIANKVTATVLIVDSDETCPPSGMGTAGQVVVCENYLYIHDGTGWKRYEISIY